MDERALDYSKRVANYIAFIVNDFSESYELPPRESFAYLRRYGGAEFLSKHYEIEHCENPIYTLESLQRICKREGGTL